MSSPSAAPALALPSGAGERPRHVLTLVALLLGAAGLVLVGALFAAYFHVRALASEWPPEEVVLDNYLGVTLALTMLLSTVTIEWAPYALKRGNRRQALWGFGLTVALGLAFLNLLWFLVAEAGFGPADHGYGTLFYALVTAAGLNAGAGIVFVLVALLRTAGRQVDGNDRELGRAASWYWHFAVASWLVVFIALYLLQNR